MIEEKNCPWCGDSFSRRENEHRANWSRRKYCSTIHARLSEQKNKTGKPTGGSLKERFEKKYKIDKETGCWLWTASLGKKGYGQISNKRGSKPFAAHRVAFTLYKNDIPYGMHVLHKCDVPACVNPDHLFLGTNLDNVNDMNQKHRGKTEHLPHPTGEDHWRTKLTKEQVWCIREDPRPARKIAKDYGVSKPAILSIKNRTNWKFLEERP